MPDHDDDTEALEAELADLRRQEAELRERLDLLVRLHRDATRPRSQEEVSRDLGMSRAAVRLLERQALLKARRFVTGNDTH